LPNDTPAYACQSQPPTVKRSVSAVEPLQPRRSAPMPPSIGESCQTKQSAHQDTTNYQEMFPAPTEATDGAAISVADLLQQAQETEETKKPKYSLQSKMCLEIQVTGRVFVKRGTMIAYRGDLKFERGSSSKNLGMKLFKMATGEGPSMMKATGYGRVSSSIRDVPFLSVPKLI